MDVRLDLDRLWLIAPRAQPDYKRAFREAPAVFEAFEISTPLRATHALAQWLHETNGLAKLDENLNYSAERLTEVWPSRFPNLQAAKGYANAPRLLANRVYNGRMGNVGPDDGWLFRGRGLPQLTGRENYTIVGRALGIDLEDDPDKACHPSYALAVAACVWKLHGCNEAADNDDLQAVTKRVNGGLIGIVSRRAWLNLARNVVRDSEVKA